MIKLNLVPKPAALTEEVRKRLVAEYKSTKAPVWKKSYIKNALLSMSNCKCAYSEQKLEESSAYMEVEHFKCKEKYPDEVVTWGNLLPACKKCNATKGTHDVVLEPILNPLVDYPKDYLYVKAFRYYPRNQNIIGERTIKVLALNDNQHFVMPRAREACLIVDFLETLFNLLKLQIDSNLAVNHTLSKIKSVLKGCGPSFAYSAVIATYIIYEWELYPQLEEYLKNNQLWDDEFEQLKNVLLSISLEK